MGEIAVIHMDLMSKGGGEAVAMNVLEALQDDHEVTLVTLREPDLDELNDFFGTDVEDVQIDRAGLAGPLLYENFGLRYYVLENALLARYARKRSDDFDLLVSTINELGLGPDSIEYIHFPFDWTVSLDNREDIFHPTVEEGSLYETLASSIANVDASALEQSTLLANSAWTAGAVEEAYGIEPGILHPPIETRGFEARSWESRQNGFVTIGRIEKSKRIVELIEIIDAVRARGHPVHLHVVGPTVDEDYRRTVEAMADEREHVFFEGELPRPTLVDLLCNHRYGIHGKRCEHFGMAVAEIAAGGAIPFVPADGGQHVLVPDERHLLYEDPAQAADRIVRVLEDPALQRELRQSLGPKQIRSRYGCERFQRDFLRHVDRALRESAALDAETAADAQETAPPTASGPTS